MSAVLGIKTTAEDRRRAAAEAIFLELWPGLDAAALKAIMARLDPQAHRTTIERHDANDPAAELDALRKALDTAAWWYLRLWAYQRGINLPPAHDLLPLLDEIERGRAFTRQHGYIERKVAEAVAMVLVTVYWELTREIPEPTRSLRKPWPRLVKATFDWACLPNWQDRAKQAAAEMQSVFSRARIAAEKRP